MKWTWIVMVCVGAVAGSGGAVRACLNDTQVRLAEDEFRSGYERKVVQPAGERVLWGIYWPGVAGLAAGLGMISLVSVRSLRRGR